jgi:hypothetical protein
LVPGWDWHVVSDDGGAGGQILKPGGANQGWRRRMFVGWHGDPCSRCEDRVRSGLLKELRRELDDYGTEAA